MLGDAPDSAAVTRPLGEVWAPTCAPAECHPLSPRQRLRLAPRGRGAKWFAIVPPTRRLSTVLLGSKSKLPSTRWRRYHRRRYGKSCITSELCLEPRHQHPVYGNIAIPSHGRDPRRSRVPDLASQRRVSLAAGSWV